MRRLSIYERAKEIFNPYKPEEHRINLELKNFQAPLFLFKIIEIDGRITQVSFNHKGWNCDYLQSEESYKHKCEVAAKNKSNKPIRFSHSYFRGKRCYHIIACKQYMEWIGLKRFLEDSPRIDDQQTNPHSVTPRCESGESPRSPPTPGQLYQEESNETKQGEGGQL